MLLSGKCTYESRYLQAAGRIEEGGSELLSALVDASEDRGSIVNKSIHWLLTGPSLKGHVLSATLKDASNPSVVLLDLPIAGASQPELSQSGADQWAGANLNGFFDILYADRGVIELQTDLPSRATITLPLATTRKNDWYRPNCS
jgi:hypothetical protein